MPFISYLNEIVLRQTSARDHIRIYQFDEPTGARTGIIAYVGSKGNWSSHVDHSTSNKEKAKLHYLEVAG